MAQSDKKTARLRLAGLLILLQCNLCGCAALTNPVADGIPVRRVPEELLCPPKEQLKQVPLTLLRQPAPDVYRLGPGDVVGVYVEGFLGERNGPLPIQPVVQTDNLGRVPASIGYPVKVQEDGTISLPFVDTVDVQGKTLEEARKAIRKLYVDKKLLMPNADRVLVSLIDARQIEVLVFRQEQLQYSVGPDGLNQSKTGLSQLVQLPAYKNDLLHALARTGGLPGLDAINQVVIYRDCFGDHAEGSLLLQNLKNGSGRNAALRPAKEDAVAGTKATLDCALGACPKIVRIPLRTPDGTVPWLKPEDIILRQGDVIFIEDREQYYYTGGLLPPGVWPLPRDTDLDVIEAVSTVRGPLFNGAFGGSNLSGALLLQGIGNPSPSQLTVIRKTPNGGQVPIVVDLRQALRDSKERINIAPGDILILQETPGEAVTRYFTITFFNFNLSWQVLHETFATGVLDVSTPDRLPDRLFPFFFP